ncbi:MAG: hypothetical protein HY917_00575, partial [Candidatus Diapherotrites archaeon]|nr:hypothetical protein [Candidatus Diapherotrites archaeon]
MPAYFLDTYALFEIVFGNPVYQRFSQNIGIATTQFNLMEFYYGLLEKTGEKEAERYFEKFRPYCSETTDEDIKAAM